MGLFTRKDRAERPTLREALAANKAKQDEKFAQRKAAIAERTAERVAEGTVRKAVYEHTQSLIRQASDRLATSDARDQAVAELIALRGERKARQLLGAYQRLQARGWIRS